MIKGPYPPSPLFYQQPQQTSNPPHKHQHTGPYYTSTSIFPYTNTNNNDNTHQNYSSHYSLPSESIASAPRTLPPHIAVQKPSEPVSPATVATTISSHSTPSPSPSRVIIMPEQGPVSNDFTLFDEALLAASQELSQKAREGSHMSLQQTESNQYSSNNFPIIVSQDASYNNNNDYSLYSSYENLGVDSATPVYDSHSSQRSIQSNYSDYNTRLGMTMAQQHNQGQLDEDDVPALSPNAAHYSTASRPSVSSSVGTFKSPVTPDRVHDVEDKMTYTPMHIHTPVPKLGRTYSDAVQDELYNPGLIQPTDYAQKSRKINHHKSASSSSLKNVMSNFPDLFQEAQQQHQQSLSPQQNHYQRDRSPFRANSPFHPVNSRFSFDPSQSLKSPVTDESVVQASATKTISPRDAMLEYTESEGEGVRINLFGPTRENSQDEINSLPLSSQGSSLEDFQSMSTASRRPSVASASSHVDMPLQYNYSQPLFNHTHYNSIPDTTGLPQAPMYEDSRSSFSEDSATYEQIERPVDTKANSGTYTCTNSGCGHRFTTSVKLQKHRRESHRRSPATSTSVSTAAAIASRNAQPGPHRCMRPNANGKPCNSIFSRPYDLTRHEDTIHNNRKEKVRCEICNDEKTFSRSDALVRHRRVKHGIH